MAAKIKLFRLLTDSQTESSPESSVSFDGTTTATGKYNHIVDYRAIMSLVAQENPLPDSNNPNPLQDTGLAIMTFELTGYFDEKDGTTGTGSPTSTIQTLRNWLREDKTNTVYKFGCFGLTNTHRSEFDVEPDHVSNQECGLILEHFELTQEYEYIGKTGFIIRLRYNGEISRLGV